MRLVHRLIAATLNFLIPFSLKNFSADVQKTKIQSLVRRYPYWRTGQLRFGELALASGSYEEAYLACQAAARLSSQDIRSELLLAKVNLRYAKYEQAENILLRLEQSADPARRNEILEYLAAAQFALVKEREAKSTLEKISSNEISMDGAVLLKHLRGKFE